MSYEKSLPNLTEKLSAKVDICFIYCDYKLFYKLKSLSGNLCTVKLVFNKYYLKQFYQKYLVFIKNVQNIFNQIENIN